MKLQGMTIIYVLIVVPLFFLITMTLSFYANDLNMKIEYDKKVRSAAQDAIQAFEINSSGEEFSKVSDVLMPLVEASATVFKDSLATQMGISNAQKEIIEENNPMNLFTLYDGFYIESLMNQPEVLRDKNGNVVYLDEKGVKSTSTISVDKAELDGADKESHNYKPVIYIKEKDDTSTPTTKEEYTTDITKAKFKKEGLVKNLIPYSAFYSKDKNKVSINYTLDNFLRVSGSLGDNSFNKSGYLLNKDFTINELKISGYDKEPEVIEALKEPTMGNDKIVERYIDEARLKGYTIELSLSNVPIEKPSNLTRTVLENKNGNLDIPNKINDVTIKYEKQMDSHYDGSGIVPGYVLPPKDENAKKEAKAQAKHKSLTAYGDQQINSIKYYLKAAKFSNWVRKNLDWVNAENMNASTISETVYSRADIFSKEMKEIYKDANVFGVIDGHDVNDENSYFNLHKKAVIQQAIYNELLVALYNYNARVYGVKSDGVIAGYQMPIIKDEDWDKILSNVSFTTFVEGFRLGQGKYNNYITVSSSNNDMFVNYNSMVFISRKARENQEGIKEDGYKDTDNEYYIKGEAFLDSIINGRVGKISINDKDNRNQVFIGLHENLFKNDGKYISSTGEYVFGYKNYQEPDVDFANIEALEKNEKINLGDGNQRKAMTTYVLGLSSQKEVQPKTINSQDNYTAGRNITDKHIAHTISGSPSIIKLTLPSFDNIDGNKTIKSITLTYTFKYSGSAADRNPNIIANVNFKLGTQTYNFVAAQSVSDAVQTVTFENGFNKDRNTLSNQITNANTKDASVDISYNIVEQNGRPIADPGNYNLTIKEVKVYIY